MMLTLPRIITLITFLYLLIEITYKYVSTKDTYMLLIKVSSIDLIINFEVGFIVMPPKQL